MDAKKMAMLIVAHPHGADDHAPEDDGSGGDHEAFISAMQSLGKALAAEDWEGAAKAFCAADKLAPCEDDDGSEEEES